MESSSSTSQRRSAQEMLQLIPCPFYGDKMLTFVCGPTGTRPGNRFYKCCRKDSGKCRFYKWQEGYEKYLSPDPGADLVEHQIQAVACPPAVSPRAETVAEQQAAVILAMVKDLLRLNLIVAGTNLMATALLLAVFIAICALIFMSRAGSD